MGITQRGTPAPKGDSGLIVEGQAPAGIRRVNGYAQSLDQHMITRLALVQGNIRALELAKLQGGCELGHHSTCEVGQRLLILNSPAARRMVDHAECADDASIGQRERYPEVCADPKSLNGGMTMHAWVAPRVLHGKRQLRLDDQAADGVRQRHRSPDGPRFGQALGTEEKLPVGIQQRNQGDGRAQETPGKPRQSVKPLVGGRVEQPRRTQRGEALCSRGFFGRPWIIVGAPLDLF